MRLVEWRGCGLRVISLAPVAGVILSADLVD